MLTIIDYGSGNLRSAAKAAERVIAENNLNLDVCVTNDTKKIRNASHIILPGQGAFGDCISGLKNVKGMIDTIEDRVLSKKTPFLGICVGMQLLASKGFEHGAHEGLNWIKGDVVPLYPDNPTLKIPHMGWNEIKKEQAHPVLKNIEDGDHFYFVHSYEFKCENTDHVLATTQYGGNVTAIIAKDNIIGAQFHPEKSQKAGLKLLENFLNQESC